MEVGGQLGGGHRSNILLVPRSVQVGVPCWIFQWAYPQLYFLHAVVILSRRTSPNQSLQVYCAVGDVQKVVASNQPESKQQVLFHPVYVSWAGMYAELMAPWNILRLSTLSWVEYEIMSTVCLWKMWRVQLHDFNGTHVWIWETETRARKTSNLWIAIWGALYL